MPQPRPHATRYVGSNSSTVSQLTYFKSTTAAGNATDKATFSTWTKTGIVTAPALTTPVGNSNLNLSLRVATYTIQALTTTAADPWGKNFSFTRELDSGSALPLGMHVGDINLRLRPAKPAGSSSAGSSSGSSGYTSYTATCSASDTTWSSFSTSGGIGGNVVAKPVAGTHGANVLAAHDVTPLLSNSAPRGGMPFPLKVVRSYDVSHDGNALVMRFNVSLPAHAKEAVEIGGLGFPMPESPGPGGIEALVWNEAHIGGDHGFVEFVRVVDDEATLLVTAEHGYNTATKFEAWRPLLVLPNLGCPLPISVLPVTRISTTAAAVFSYGANTFGDVTETAAL